MLQRQIYLSQTIVLTRIILRLLLSGNNREVEMFIKTKDLNAEDPAQFLELQQLSSSIFQSKVSMLRGGETAKELAILLRLLK